MGGKMSYSARIVLDSLAPSGGRLTTFEVTFPRFILAEFNTHRMLSKNSASSRAIPTDTALKKVLSDPFIPEQWGGNQRGMQAGEEIKDTSSASKLWFFAARFMAGSSNALGQMGVHKQLANRLTEPFVWHTAIVSGTEWDNFFALRNNPMSQPEFQKIAGMMQGVYLLGEPLVLKMGAGEWHLPLVTGIDYRQLADEGYQPMAIQKISAARCARVSYLTHNKTRDPQADLELFERLASEGHMSPLEHVAQALDNDEWESECRVAAEQWMERKVPVGNYWGWLQYRKTFKNEHDFSKVAK